MELYKYLYWKLFVVSETCCKFGNIREHFIFVDSLKDMFAILKIHRLDCTLPVSSDFITIFIGELESKYCQIVVLYVLHTYLQCCRGVGQQPPLFVKCWH